MVSRRALGASDKIATQERTWSRHPAGTIIVAAEVREKSQVSGDMNGRAPGTRTQNLWIKSPQLCENPPLDGLPLPVLQCHYVSFDPRLPFAWRRISRKGYGALPDGTATYEHPPSTRIGRWAWMTMRRVIS